MENKENMEEEDTQPVEIEDSGYVSLHSQSQTQSQPELLYWGRLYPLKTALETFDLTDNTVTFGKNLSCDIRIAGEKIPKEVYVTCSKVHFEIRRKQIEVMGAPTTQIDIIDKSCNGTFINGSLLHKKKRVLRTNDVIGLPISKKRGVSYEVYVYIDSLDSASNSIPPRVRNKYEVSKRLGLGTFGEVSLVFCKDSGRPYAMKTIVKDSYTNDRKAEGSRKKLLNEIKILETVNHANVIRLVDVLYSKMENFLILEFMEGKDLACRIKENNGINEDLAKLYFYQITDGVRYLHSRGIIHRDLKPANILMASTNMETVLKVTDFGLSKALSSESEMKTLCGTKMYVAPEILIGGGVYPYSEKVDVWSLGVILYVMLSDTDPFSSSSLSLEDQIKEAVYPMPSHFWDTISYSAKNLIHRMLTKDPDERISIPDIFEDWWLKDEQMLAKVRELCDHYSSPSEIDDDLLFSEASTSTLCMYSDIDTDGFLTEDLTLSERATTSPARKKFKVK